MPSIESRSLSYQNLIRVRTICLILMCGLLWFSEDIHSASVVSVGWELLFFNVALSLVFSVLGKSKKLVPFLLPFVFLVDGFFVSLWIGVSGGPVSYYAPFILLVLVHSILVLRFRTAVVVVTLLIAMLVGFFYVDYYWNLSTTFGADQINSLYNLLVHSAPAVRKAVYFHQSLRWFFYCFLMAVVVAMAMKQVWGREEKLRHKERLLEQKRHLIQMGEMTGRIAHGVNTPLGLISGNLELLMAETRKTSKTYKHLDQINEYVQRAIHTVRDILDYGRQSMSQIKPVSFGKTAQAVALAVQPKLKKTGGHLILDIDPHLPQTLGYAEGLFQALLNLVENAIDSIDKGGLVTLSVKFHYRSMRLSAQDERGEIQVIIRDNGQGIPPEKLTHIFEPFYSTKDFGKGTGLGLAIVKRIVDEHNGTLEVSSQVGTGTTFTLNFPVEETNIPKSTDAEDFYYNKSEPTLKDADQ